VPSIIYSAVPSGEAILIRAFAETIRTISFFLRNSTQLQYRTLVDIAVVDKLRTVGRFAVNYVFLSMSTNQRLIVQLFATETSTIPSLAVPFANGQRLFAAAAWLEREV
jgi:NADH:ubiquinone oxidoreductase subunit C